MPRAFEPPAVNVGVNTEHVMVSAADPRDQLLQGALARIQMLESVVQQVPFLMVTVQDLQQRLGRLESQVGATSTAGAGLNLMRLPSAYQSGGVGLEPARVAPGLTYAAAASACPSEMGASEMGDLGDSLAG